MENWSFVVHNSVNRRLHQKEYTKEESQYVTALLGLYTESHTLRYLWVFLMSLVVPALKATSPQGITSSSEREKRELQLAVFWDTLIVYLGHVCENSTASRVADVLNSTSPAIPWADQLYNTQTNRLHGERLTTTAYPTLLYKKLLKAANAFGVHVPSTDQITFSEQMKKNNKMTPRAPTGPAQTSYPYELVSYFRHAMGGCSSTNVQQTNTMSHQEQEQEQEKSKALRADDVPEHIRNFYTREPVVTSWSTREPQFTSSSQKTGKTATGRENNHIQSQQPSASSNNDDHVNHHEQGQKKEEEGKKQSDIPSENIEEDLLDDIEEEISPEERDLLRQYESMSLETLRKKQEKKATTLRKNNKKWYHQVWVYLSFILLAVGTVLLVRLLANNVDVNSATEKILPSPLNKPARRDNNNNNDGEANSEGKNQSKVKGKLKDEKQSSSKKE
jgi:hypothetical protein